MMSVKRKLLDTRPCDHEYPNKAAKEEEDDDSVGSIRSSNEPITCLLDVSYPNGYNSVRTVRKGKAEKPAKEFPFQLHPFQSEAIGCLGIGELVMVSARTSVALYAIDMCLHDGQRVTYTSPIKALSNKKYREFKEEFGDVGLMTGDVTIEPNVSCLVMTTEI